MGPRTERGGSREAVAEDGVDDVDASPGRSERRRGVFRLSCLLRCWKGALRTGEPDVRVAGAGPRGGQEIGERAGLQQFFDPGIRPRPLVLDRLELTGQAGDDQRGGVGAGSCPGLFVQSSEDVLNETLSYPLAWGRGRRISGGARLCGFEPGNRTRSNTARTGRAGTRSNNG